jgi:hypothetical protein
VGTAGPEAVVHPGSGHAVCKTSRPASARGRITLGSDFVGFTSAVGNYGVTACGASGASRCRPSLG